MPSPIAHMAAGYAIYQVYDLRRPRSCPQIWGRVPLLMLAMLGLSLLPDLDSVVGILFGDFGRFHNGWTHSLLVGLGLATVVGSLALFRQFAAPREWFLIALLCYGLHVVMDYFTIGRGAMLFWPLTLARFQAPVKAFYGLHWSDGLFSFRHVWSLLSELGFAAVIMLLIHVLGRYMGHFRSVRAVSGQSPQRAPEESQ